MENWNCDQVTEAREVVDRVEAAVEQALAIFRRALPAVVQRVAWDAAKGNREARRLALDVLEGRLGDDEARRLMAEALLPMAAKEAP